MTVESPLSSPSAESERERSRSSSIISSGSTISAQSQTTERPPSPTPSPGIGIGKRPTLLRPPATIISPPSPIEPTSSTLPIPSSTSTSGSRSNSPLMFSSSPIEKSDEEEFHSTPPPKSRQSKSRGGSGAKANIPSGFFSPSLFPNNDSPGSGPSASNGNNGNRRDSLAVPIPDSESPFPQTPSSDGGVESPSASASDSGLPPGSGKRRGKEGYFPPPTPSSPHAYPKRIGHRRESSTHRVKETPNGKQRNTEDGETMVNQYKIGKGLGKGGFAKVELAVDVGTGIEYAIKEFSQSRLHTQSLQEKQRLALRGRAMRARGRGRGRGGGEGGGERRCSMSNSESDSDLEKVGGVKGISKEGIRRSSKAGEEGQPSDPLKLIRREIAVMKKLDHPNIVHLYEAISVPNADALYLVLEYLPGGVIMSVKMGDDKPSEPSFPDTQAREYFRQLILGLEYLHANGVIHRDIKPDNILLSEDKSTVKLCDFGVSEMFVVEASDDRIKKSGGSPAFLSPESFTTHTHEVHGKLVDIWALGVTLYCMLTGSLPFNTENPIELFEMVQNEEPVIPDTWEENQKDLVRRMLRKEPSFRIHLFMIREHPWVTEDGTNPMISKDDNLYHVGKLVEEPTQEELKSAVGVLRGAFTVIRAVQKMRRLQLARRSLTSTPASSPPIRGETLDSNTSTNFSDSREGGSMDSYISDINTDNTSMEGGGETPSGEGNEAREETVSPAIVKKLKGKGKEDGEVPDMNLDGERKEEELKSSSMNGLRISTDGSKPEAVGENKDEDNESGEVPTFDSPVDHDSPQMMDSPIDDEDKAQSGAAGGEEVQIFHSPVEDEADQVPVVKDIKGRRPRPRPRP